MKRQYIAIRPKVNSVATGDGGNGLWVTTKGDDSLIQLASKLPTAEKTDIHSREDLTVPTPWSGVVSFDILLDSVAQKLAAAVAGAQPQIDYGPVQEQAERDWRALIALIALRKVRSVPITFKTVDIEKSTDIFCKEVYKHIPATSVFSDHGKAWSKITLILLEQEVIGVLTPTNLVCSRYYYYADDTDAKRDATPKAAQWLIKHKLMEVDAETDYCRLKDPIEDFIAKDHNFTAQPESIAYICAWLNKVKDTVTATPFTGKGSTADSLIAAFIQDINTMCPMAGLPTHELHSIVPSSALYTPEELVNNIQGQHALMGMLTAIAYSKFADYEISYIPMGEGNPYKCHFNNAIFNGPAVCAAVLEKKDKFGNAVCTPYCLGALSNDYLLTVSNNIGKSDVLIQHRIMNEGAEYQNPVEFATENAEKYVYISEWMTKVSAALNNAFPMKANGLCNEISAFAAALMMRFNEKYPAGTHEATKALNYKTNGFVSVVPGVGATIEDIFRNTKVTVDMVATGIAESVKIIDSTEMVFSEQAIGKELMALYGKQLAGDPSISIVTPPENTFFDSRSVFNDKICYVEMDHLAYSRKAWRFGDAAAWSIAQPEETDGEHYTVLWPINPKVLAHVSAESILNDLSFTYHADEDKCSVSLTCKLAGGGESTVTKSYTGPFTENMADHEIIDQNDIPGFSVWPFVKNNGWYSVYQSDALEMGKKTFDACLMPQDSSETRIKWDKVSGGECERRVIYRTVLPEYAEVHDNVGNNMGWIRFDTPDKDVQALVNGGTMTVGLDFGTSSTAVYAKIGVGHPERVDFSAIEARTFIKHANDDKNIYYIPDTYGDKNFYPSILRMSSNAPTSSKMLDLGNILFKYEYEKDSSVNGQSTVESDMKWDQNNNSKKAYLTQIIMQTIMWGKLQGPSKINWHVSYPSAFSENMEFTYKNMLNEVIYNSASLLKVTNVDDFGNPVGADIVSMQTESIASANYLMDGGLANNLIVIDIGGGSTDVSLWAPGPHAKVQSSFNIASRKIFLEPLVEFVKTNKSMQECIANINVGDKKPFAEIGMYIEQYDTDPAKYSTQINRLIEQALLNHHEQIINQMKALPANNIERKRFERKIIAGFFAIVYFTVETVKSGLEDLTVAVNISLVGNGAKLYNWILGGYINNINAYLNGRIKEISGNELFHSITPVVDATAKTEAAQGLLKPLPAGGILKGPSVLAGINMKLKYTQNGVEQAPYEIKEEDFFFDADSDPATDIVKLCLDGTAYKAIECDIDSSDIEKHYNQFMSLVANDIFKGEFPVPAANTVAIKTKVVGLMNSAFINKLIQSPLFCVLVSAIDMLS